MSGPGQGLEGAERCVCGIGRCIALCVVIGAGFCHADDWWPLVASSPARLSDETDALAPAGYRHAAPSAQRILTWLFDNASLRLSSLPTCETVGVTFDDSTLGQYFAGLLQFHSDSAADNHTAICCDPLTSPDGARLWLCSVMVYSSRGELVLSQGTSFLVNDHGMRVVEGSFRCPGAG